MKMITRLHTPPESRSWTNLWVWTVSWEGEWAAFSRSWLKLWTWSRSWRIILANTISWKNGKDEYENNIV